MSRTIALLPEPLTAEAFRAFGDVIETRDAHRLINRGTTRQFADLARIDVATNGGRPCLSIYRVVPYSLPLAIAMLERHPLGSQCFIPLHDEQFLIVVAPAGERIECSNVRAFVSNGRQGINYVPGTWHHPIIALRDPSEFLVIDRGGPGKNCDEHSFSGDDVMLQSPVTSPAGSDNPGNLT